MTKIKRTINSILSICSVLGFWQGLYAYVLLFVAKRTKSQVLIERKHEIIRRYIKQSYCGARESTSLHESVIPRKTLDKKHNIWVFWYQGKDSMPNVVRLCYERLCGLNISDDCDVHLISEYNVDEYLTFPEYITKKVESGRITLTHFSDILRFALLYHYSGFWIDATVWCEQRVPNAIYDRRYWSIRLPHPQYTISVSYMRWSIFILWLRDVHDPLARCVLDMLLAYWQREDNLVDYLLIDYFLEYAIDGHRAGAEFLSIEKSNSHVYALMQKLKDDFERQEWYGMRSDTIFFKLSYKGSNVQKAIDNPNSYYNTVVRK